MTRGNNEESRSREAKPLSAYEAGKLAPRAHDAADTAAAPAPAADLAAEYLGGEGLTWRQRQILAWISDGWSNERISTEIGREVGTVEKHIENLFKKLRVHSRTDAVIAFLRRQNEDCHRKRTRLVRQNRRLLLQRQACRNEIRRLQEVLAKAAR